MRSHNAAVNRITRVGVNPRSPEHICWCSAIHHDKVKAAIRGKANTPGVAEASHVVRKRGEVPIMNVRDKGLQVQQ
jgi:hypothetical protein